MNELKPTILEVSSIFTINLWNGSVYVNHGMVATPEKFFVYSVTEEALSLYSQALFIQNIIFLAPAVH